jgi:hypothetical protein
MRKQPVFCNLFSSGVREVFFVKSGIYDLSSNVKLAQSGCVPAIYALAIN